MRLRIAVFRAKQEATPARGMQQSIAEKVRHVVTPPPPPETHARVQLTVSQGRSGQRQWARKSGKTFWRMAKRRLLTCNRTSR